MTTQGFYPDLGVNQRHKSLNELKDIVLKIEKKMLERQEQQITDVVGTDESHHRETETDEYGLRQTFLDSKKQKSKWPKSGS